MRVICKDVSKVYPTTGRTVVALEGVTFETGESEFVCVVGPSGCGKTTLLKIVAGLIPPTSGRIDYSGTRQGAPLNAMVFQEDSVFPWMSVLNNVAFPLEVQGISRSRRTVVAHEMIERVGLRQFAGHYPHELSTGMKQRVGIARALAVNPEVLLMDEPFAALDAQMKAVLQEELVNLWSRFRRTVLYVTHDIEEAIFLGDRVLVMSRNPGRLIADVRIPFPRPRDFAIRGSPEFADLKQHIWLMIREEVMQAMQQQQEQLAPAGS